MSVRAVLAVWTLALGAAAGGVALILASDHDAIRGEHTLEIFHHIPNSRLAIFPNATHMIPFDDPATFNTTVERFLSTPFVKRDWIKDMLQSIEKLEALEHPGTNSP